MLTRLAPSPTGALHLGNARTFLVTWLLARRTRVAGAVADRRPGRPPREGLARPPRPSTTCGGSAWTGTTARSLQSARGPRPTPRPSRRLLGRGSRLPVRLHPPGGRRRRQRPPRRGRRQRLPRHVPGPVRDGRRCHQGRRPATGHPLPRAAGPDRLGRTGFAGRQLYPDVAASVGRLRRRQGRRHAGVPVGRVVTDDAAAGVTHVVRGDDLLASTPRQVLLLGRALGLGRRDPGPRPPAANRRPRRPPPGQAARRQPPQPPTADRGVSAGPRASTARRLVRPGRRTPTRHRPTWPGRFDLRSPAGAGKSCSAPADEAALLAGRRV